MKFTETLKSILIGISAAALMTVLTLGVIVLGTALFIFDTLKNPIKRERDDAPGEPSEVVRFPAGHRPERHPETGFPVMGEVDK